MRVLSRALGLILDAGYVAAGLPWLALSFLRARPGKALDHLRRRAFTALAPRDGDRPCVWFHGVSVGEVLAARGLIVRCARELPGVDVAVSSSTRLGVEAAAKQFPAARVISAPLDLSPLVARAFRRLRPDVVVIVEHDLWPNFLLECARRGVDVALINARASRRPPGMLVRRLALVCAQNEESARCFEAAGVPRSRIRTTGNLKFDNPPPAGALASPADLGLAPSDWVFLAASTHAGEEEAALAALAALRAIDPASRLVIAPRRTERTAEVRGLVAARGLSCALWSDPLHPSADVIVVDTIGDLARIAGAAAVVFVGGTLVPVGGHNVIEPASLGRAVIVGPHCFNQESIVLHFRGRGALVEVKDAGGLAAAVRDLRRDPDRCRELGALARCTVEENIGAAERTFEGVARLLSAARARRGGA